MRKPWKLSLLLVLALVIAGVPLLGLSGCSIIGAESFDYRDVKAEDGTDAVSLYRYTGESRKDKLVIPDEVKGKRVVRINTYALSNAEYLTEITLGKYVETIEAWAITKCLKLEKIAVAEGNEHFVVKDNILYTQDMKSLVLCPNVLRGKDDGGKPNFCEVTLPEGVERIGTTAFYCTETLTQVRLPASLRYIDSFAFHYAKELTSLNLPAGLLSIGRDAFSYCDKMKGSVTIPASVMTIGDYAFFSEGSSIGEFIVERYTGEGSRSLGVDWVPSKLGSVSDKVTVREV